VGLAVVPARDHAAGRLPLVAADVERRRVQGIDHLDAAMSTKDAICFCNSCGGREDEPALPECTKRKNHPEEE
jgi:hypothetical protein